MKNIKRQVCSKNDLLKQQRRHHSIQISNISHKKKKCRNKSNIKEKKIKKNGNLLDDNFHLCVIFF